jgi:hypothetical protein
MPKNVSGKTVSYTSMQQDAEIYFHFNVNEMLKMVSGYLEMVTNDREASGHYTESKILVNIGSPEIFP